jgi:phosphate transport system permease protein
MSQNIVRARLDGREGGLNKRFRPLDDLIRYVLFACGAISILTTIGIIVVLSSEAINFFTSYGEIDTNNQTLIALDEVETQIDVTQGGGTLRLGDLLRLQSSDELMRVVEVVDRDTVIVERGVEGTTATAHEVRREVYIAKQVTLLEFVTGTRWQPQIGNFGIWPLLQATINISVIALLVAVPIGMGTAIYLSEYASERTRSILKPTLEILAGIPTVVLGYFALTFMTPLLRSLLGANTVQIYNQLSAGIVVGFMIVPLISTVSEDAMRAVPRALKEASFALGATRFETAIRVLIPAALSGIIAAFILAGSRAFGETMIVAIAAGAGPNYTFNPFEAAETITGHIARISTGDLSYGTMDYKSLFSLGLVLFLVTLVLNLISNYITERFREVYQ